MPTTLCIAGFGGQLSKLFVRNHYLTLIVHATIISVHVGIIEIEDVNSHTTNKTIEYYKNLGVPYVGLDRMRSFGRASELVNISSSDKDLELCGHCWNSSICITPTGDVHPCIMSRHHLLGNVQTSTIEDIISDQNTYFVRKNLLEKFATNFSLFEPQINEDTNTVGCYPSGCYPTEKCWPSGCNPQEQCWPSGCNPKGN